MPQTADHGDCNNLEMYFVWNDVLLGSVVSLGPSMFMDFPL